MISDFWQLLSRATRKIENNLESLSCGDEEEALFRAGKPSACSFGNFFTRKHGEDSYNVFLRQSENVNLFGNFGGGANVVDATMNEEQKLEHLLVFIETTLDIKRDVIKDIPEPRKPVATADQIDHLSRDIVTFAKGKDCSEKASVDFLLGLDTNCEVGNFFFKRIDDANYEVRMKIGINQTDIALLMIDGKLLVRPFDDRVRHYTDPNKIIPDLTGAFITLK